MAIGQYHFHRHYRAWGIWMVESISNGVTMSAFVMDVQSYEDAVRKVYALNGWGEPKHITRKF